MLAWRPSRPESSATTRASEPDGPPRSCRCASTSSTPTCRWRSTRCWRPWPACCSSPVRTSPTSRSFGARAVSASWRSACRSVPAGHGWSSSCWWRAPFSPSLSTAVGVALAVVGMRALVAMAPPGTPFLDDVGLDGRVLVAAIAAGAVAMVIAGVIPAVLASSMRTTAALRDGSAGGRLVAPRIAAAQRPRRGRDHRRRGAGQRLGAPDPQLRPADPRRSRRDPGSRGERKDRHSGRALRHAGPPAAVRRDAGRTSRRQPRHRARRPHVVRPGGRRRLRARPDVRGGRASDAGGWLGRAARAVEHRDPWLLLHARASVCGRVATSTRAIPPTAGPS